MKTLTNILLLLSIFSLSSCFFTRNVNKEVVVRKEVQTPYEAEVDLETKPVAVFKFASDSDVNDFLYENEDLKVFYNFRGKNSTNGTLEFRIENKTNQNIFVDLAYSSFINNGRANNYKDAVDITGKVLLIPDHSYLAIDKFEGVTTTDKANIEALIKDTYYSIEKQKLFTREKSPLVFRNKMAYGFKEDMTESKLIDNRFWVDQLNVYSQEKFDSLESENKNEFKNKLLYTGKFMRKGMVTKYRPEVKDVKENITVRKKVFAPIATAILIGGIALGVLLIILAPN
jgi:hypothetical protein